MTEARAKQHLRGVSSYKILSPCLLFQANRRLSERLQLEAKKHQGTLTYYACDISNLDVTYSVFQKAVAESRFPLRGLVNCAGIGWLGDTIDFPLDDARRILDVNLIGTLVCAQAGARLVREHGFSASFVFIASMSGYVVNKVGFLLYPLTDQKANA